MGVWYVISRLLPGIICWCTAHVCCAQKAPELDYLIRFQAPITSVQEKYIHEVLQTHEPGLGVWVDVPLQQVKVRTHVPLTRADLELAWSPVGLLIDRLEPIGSTSEAVHRSTDAFPVYVSTGNPPADDAAYDAAKQAWIQEHPAAYQKLCEGDPVE
jgi:hypothetical protein